ncbi:MAG TPA: hypothetical protein VGI14_07010 [Casimicrobiaceae bacterium]|jgi:hypothetical protein
MARYETREIATCLPDGSAWVGRFTVTDGELNFGDDRFDAAHGLASVEIVAPTASTRERDTQVHRWMPCPAFKLAA